MLSDVAALFHIKTVLQSVDYRQRPIDVADFSGNFTVFHIALGELDLVESAFHQHLNEAVRRGVFNLGMGANLIVLLQRTTGIHIFLPLNLPITLIGCTRHVSATTSYAFSLSKIPWSVSICSAVCRTASGGISRITSLVF